jgi:peptidoglycan/LPS O-acetylase OafA/YrhL
MIQRIQTIFLILAACSFGALFLFPFATSDVSAAHFLADKVYGIQDHLALLSISIFLIGVSVFTIFLFRNRKLQRRLVYLIIILSLGLGIAAYILLKMDTGETLLSAGIHGKPGILLPLAGMIFCFLAGYFIGKDDKLVKSMDRLR